MKVTIVSIVIKTMGAFSKALVNTLESTEEELKSFSTARLKSTIVSMRSEDLKVCCLLISNYKNYKKYKNSGVKTK